MGSFSTFYLNHFNKQACKGAIHRIKEETHLTAANPSSMASSIAITASLSRHVTNKKKQQQPPPPPPPPPQARPAGSIETKQETHVVHLQTQGQKGLSIAEPPAKFTFKDDDSTSDNAGSGPKFSDERWKNGTWDLNMFVRDGKMDWDSVIVAEARRRKFLEMHPESATNQEPVTFRSSIIPWWAWIKRSHLPEAELINGRAAMVGFFMAYLVDGLTGLDLVGQKGNLVCKAGLLVTVISVMLFRRGQDLEKLKKLADEATFYEKQWQASWQDQDAGATDADSERGGKKI